MASSRSNGKRPSAATWAEPAPASTRNSYSPARTATHAWARPGAGSGEEVPQRNTLSPSYWVIGDGRCIAAVTAFSSSQACPILEFQDQSPIAMARRSKPPAKMKSFLNITSSSLLNAHIEGVYLRVCDQSKPNLFNDRKIWANAAPAAARNSVSRLRVPPVYISDGLSYGLCYKYNARSLRSD